VSERALASLLAWKLKQGSNILENNREELGETPEFKAALGYLKACQGAYDEAKRLLTAARDANPTDPAPAHYLGETLRWQRKHDAAREAWKAAHDRAKALVKKDPNDARAQYYLGVAQLRREKFSAARVALTAAAEAAFDSKLISFQMGLSYLLDSKWQLATEAFTELEKADPKFAHLYFYRGVAWGRRDRKDLMLNDMENFLALAPNAPEADIARTYLAAKKG
jgi:tetratricopeptide (TPR) repeat protein